ncbi:cobalt-precorrin-6A reductase [Nodosilinea sp. PGN35]|uniref:cobalt-precorrin-6A reductase n=1 Tax=Nodosilinea sp. PGN35 TaxID=3020489 RepID=UPI0023B207C8|nr:cobalt-precorrin-6A reductase [Nodosilinea sp. TSF1-S3]MDF0367576.1 cobalt-precorrin-6A reductase [Nodosilinea sp. TSF1-S3]
MGALWVIGGTGEAVALATALAAAGVPCVVTVTTEVARHSYQESATLRVRVGALAVEALWEFIRGEDIGAVLDVSHPFAVEISKGAIAVTQALNLPYWRYERPTIDHPPHPRLHYVSDLTALLTPDILVGQRVLLTLGYRWLQHFMPWQTKTTLFARILPSPVALEAALQAGFTPDRLIALRPPITADLERALWQQWGITRVITKASGGPGGETTKRAIAEQLGVSLTILNRPRLDYPAVCPSPAAALATCLTWWQAQHPHL